MTRKTSAGFLLAVAAACHPRVVEVPAGELRCPRESLGAQELDDPAVIGASPRAVLSAVDAGPLDGVFRSGGDSEDGAALFGARLTFRFVPVGPPIGYRDLGARARFPEAVCPHSDHLEWTGVMAVFVEPEGGPPFTLALPDVRVRATGGERSDIRVLADAYDPFSPSEWLLEVILATVPRGGEPGQPYWLRAGFNATWQSPFVSVVWTRGSAQQVWATWSPQAALP